jgi:putative SOS response-associated peptidase YedK
MILGLLSDSEIIERKFASSIPTKNEYTPNFNQKVGNSFLFLSSSNKEFETFQHGMIPSFLKNSTPLYYAPVEGDKIDTETDHLKKGIIQSKYFRRSIREQRGLLPVDYFVIQNEEGAPYLIFQKDKKRPMGIGCVWDCHKNDILDNLTYGFAIITLPAYGILKDIGIKRLPVVIKPENYNYWLRQSHLTEVTNMLCPMDEDFFNAFPISKEILTSSESSRHLIEPIGEKLLKEEKSEVGKIIDGYKQKWHFNKKEKMQSEKIEEGTFWRRHTVE